MTHDGSPLSPFDHIRIYRQLAGAIRDAGIKVDLGPLQIEILCVLHQHDGPALASHNLLPVLAVRLTTLTQALKSLHRKRLVRYVQHPTNRRLKRIALSSLGRERVQRFFRHFQTVVDDRLDQQPAAVELSV